MYNCQEITNIQILIRKSHQIIAPLQHINQTKRHLFALIDEKLSNFIDF